MKLFKIDEKHRTILVMKDIKYNLSNEFNEIKSFIDSIKFAKYLSSTQQTILKNFYGPKFDKFEQQVTEFIFDPNLDFSIDPELADYKTTAQAQLEYLKRNRSKLKI